jgi:hypothetical protein
VPEAKPYSIPKQLVWEAYQRVKANRGAAGVDGESLATFGKDLKRNLYKIWNRMSSGSYFPPPVRLVEIKKDDGGKRPLGIPTVSAYCTSYNTVSECPRPWFRILEERRTHSSNSCSFSSLMVIQ